MSAATLERPAGSEGSKQRGAFSGTAGMLRFMLRRDRIRFPGWVLGLTMLMAYFANALGTVLGPDELDAFLAFVSNPIMGLIGGPGYGLDAGATIPRILAGVYAVYVMLGAGLMGITTISRHTRVEEQTGCAELIRASVVGRHAQLAAALIMAVTMSVVMSVLIGLAILGSTIDPQPEAAGSFLFGFSIGAVAMVFAAVGAVTMQLSAFSRAASGMAGAFLGVSFMVRGFGDMSAVADGDLDWLAWLSPLGWSQQTAPFTLDRWWPLAFSLAATLVLAAIAFALQSRRDLAAGMLPERLGNAEASSFLRNPVALSFRLQRAGLIGWTVALAVAGVAFGAFVEPMREAADGMPEEITALMGGADQIVDGYVGFMSIYMALIVTVFAVLSVQSLRGEEHGYRTEPVLSTAVSRPAWMLSWSAVTALGVVWLMLVAGAATGIGAAAMVGDWSLFGPATLGHVAQSAPVLVLLGLAIALYGIMPRLLNLVWAVVVYSSVLTMFGELLSVDEAVQDTSLFQHVGEHPLEDISWGAVGVLVAITVALILIGTAAFRRRDLVTA